jgi:hypothetical protein
MSSIPVPPWDVPGPQIPSHMADILRIRRTKFRSDGMNAHRFLAPFPPRVGVPPNISKQVVKHATASSIYKDAMTSLLTLLLLCSPAAAVTCTQRHRVVQSYNVRRTASSSTTPLQVGNGNFAFGADVTGLQTFMPYGIMSTWGWHNFSLPTTVNQTSVEGMLCEVKKKKKKKKKKEEEKNWMRWAMRSRERDVKNLVRY